MALQMSYSPRSQIYKSAFCFKVAYVPSSGIFANIVAYNDMVLAMLNYRLFYVESNPKPSSQITGFDTGESQSTEVLTLSRPVFQRQPRSTYDHEVYGSFSDNVAQFIRVLTGETHVIPALHNEKFCSHATYSGSLISKQADVPTAYSDCNFFGRTIRIRNTGGYIYGGATVNSVHPLTITPVPWYYSSLGAFNVFDFLDDVKGLTHDFLEYQSGNLVHRQLADLRYTVSGDGLVITYHHSAINLTVGDGYEWDNMIVVPFTDMDSRYSPSVGVTYYTDYKAPVSYEYFNGHVISTPYPWDYGPMEEHYLGTGEARIFSCYLSLANHSDPVQDAGVFTKAFSDLNEIRFLEPFARAVTDDIYNIASSSIFSAVDAFKEAEGSLDVNVLQNLAKIPSIASAIPDLRRGVDVLGRLLRRDLSLSTLREILSLASSTNLQANFQWRPFYSLFTDYLPRLISTWSTLGNIQRNTIGYGSFSRTLTNVLGRESVHLVTRSKIVMASNPNKLLSATLGLDALGLLPKASNLWDLIPFSFVANWFTGIGSSIRAAEYSVLLQGIPCYFVHSYLLTSPLSSYELDSLQMSSSGKEVASLRVYWRDISLFVPFPRDSHFGFGIPTSLPSGGLIGSLLFQLIFH